MALRRFAQTNHASAADGSPRPKSSAFASPAGSPQGLPTTPRNRLSFGLHRSPADTPSISSSVPFDWEAARALKPPPYASPRGRVNGRDSLAPGNGPKQPIKRVVKKKGLWERSVILRISSNEAHKSISMTLIPSQIALEISLFPNNVPLPEPKTSAYILGGLMHFTHLCTRISAVRKVPDSEQGYEDMYYETEGTPWFDWVSVEHLIQSLPTDLTYTKTMPMTLLLIGASIGNAVYLFSRIQVYRLHHRPEPVGSPSAKFVPDDVDLEPLVPTPLFTRILSFLWRAFVAFWRFLLGLKPSVTSSTTPGNRARVQQMEVWAPGEFELMLFSIYSPAHSLLWTATTTSNWMIMLIIMGLLGLQVRLTTTYSFSAILNHAMKTNVLFLSYKTLLKDKEIISAEVMNEYNKLVLFIPSPYVCDLHKSRIVRVPSSQSDPQGCRRHDTSVRGR